MIGRISHSNESLYCGLVCLENVLEALEEELGVLGQEHQTRTETDRLVTAALLNIVRNVPLKIFTHSQACTYCEYC